MREGLGVLLLVVLGAPGLVSLLTILTVLFPRTVRKAEQAAGAMPGRSLVLGMVNLLFLSALVLVLSAGAERAGQGLLGVLAVLPGLGLVSGLLFGLSALSAQVGARLVPQRGTVSQVVIGAAALVLASLTPILGWLVFFPYVAMVGLGSLVIGLFGRTPDRSE